MRRANHYICRQVYPQGYTHESLLFLLEFIHAIFLSSRRSLAGSMHMLDLGVWVVIPPNSFVVMRCANHYIHRRIYTQGYTHESLLFLLEFIHAIFLSSRRSLAGSMHMLDLGVWVVIPPNSFVVMRCANHYIHRRIYTQGYTHESLIFLLKFIYAIFLSSRRSLVGRLYVYARSRNLSCNPS